jgi:hypothetical protein
MIVGDLVTPGAIGTATGASRLRGSFEYPVSSQKGGNGEVNEVRHSRENYTMMCGSAA